MANQFGITVRWSGRQAHCVWMLCKWEGQITAGQLIARGTGNTNGHWYSMMWHWPCYILHTESYYEEHPYVPTARGTAGRPRIDITNEQRAQRRKLITKAFRIRRSKEQASAMALWWRVEELENDQKELMIEFEAVGGIPSNWLA